MTAVPAGDGGGLTKEQQQELADDLAQERLVLTSTATNPTAILTGGQPGSGKSAIKARVVDRFIDDGGIIDIDPDDIRPTLPYMDAYLCKGGSAIPEFANKDAGDVAYLVLQMVKTMQHNVLVDGTLRNTARAQDLALDLKTTGFTVEFHGMAVYADLSHARTYLRREKEIQLSTTGFGRTVDDGFHHEAVKGYAATVKAFYTAQSVGRMVLYDQAGNVVTDVKLAAGTWTLSSTGAAVPAANNPIDLLHRAHNQPDAATLHEAATTWSEARQLASSRTPAAADVDNLAQHQAEAEAKARRVVTQPIPGKSYRGKIIAITDFEVLQAVGKDVISHRRAGLVAAAGKALLLDVGINVKVAYGSHIDDAIIQPYS